MSRISHCEATLPPYALLLRTVAAALDPAPYLFCCDEARSGNGAGGRLGCDEASGSSNVRYDDSSMPRSSRCLCATLLLLVREGCRQSAMR
ncbi:hypothetical protein E2562_028076 [Oryza meyeriana var. granulata]|uniref:Uncharacterized protein n=1 Tax=Oryza meyeriana var. granulata TaxID=110450 RepID=A0A6G1C082_9ORYZ|nr:hypothetical protein E2562_028076 [Oryza meyeriana var. granulata]